MYKVKNLCLWEDFFYLIMTIGIICHIKSKVLFAFEKLVLNFGIKDFWYTQCFCLFLYHCVQDCIERG